MCLIYYNGKCALIKYFRPKVLQIIFVFSVCFSSPIKFSSNVYLKGFLIFLVSFHLLNQINLFR